MVRLCRCAHGEGFDIPGTVFATFQMMFAVITPLLITGAFSERVPFGSFCCFIILWSIVIYYPVCHWVWGGGWLATLWDGMGAVDFAGGIVIHTTAGVSSLIVAIVLGAMSHLTDCTHAWLAYALWFGLPLAYL